MARIRRKVTRTGAKPTRKVKKIVLTDEEKEKRRAADIALGAQLSKIKQYTVVAAGTPPYDLEGDTLEDVSTWVGKLRNTKVNHTVQSCQFWVKYFFCPFDQKEQWKSVRSLIEENHEALGLPNIPRAKFDESKVDRSKLIGQDFKD
jgi:hypothetical protein